MDYKKRNYLICLIVFVFLFIIINGFFFFGEMNTIDVYLTLGAGRMEWILACNLMIISILVSGILALYIGIPGFLKTYIKFIGKKQQIGIVPEEQLSGKSHLLKLWIRAIILGFFIANISYTLSANESFVQFMLTTEGEANMRGLYGGQLLIPDPMLMIQLLWMLAIPLTFLLVPIWFLIDVGLVSSKKVKGVSFSSVNLATSRFYKIIKGYAGIGFTYNLIIMIIDWITKRADTQDPFNMVYQIMSPLTIISATFPLIILMDYQKERFKAKAEKTLITLDLNKELKCTIELIDRR